MSSITATTQGSNSESLAQLDAAQQLIAAANLLQHQNNNNNNTTTNNNNISDINSKSMHGGLLSINTGSAITGKPSGNSLLCSICGITAANANELQAHFLSHQQQLDNMLAPGQFNYGMHLLNLLQNSRSSANNSPSPSLPGISSPTPKSTPSATSTTPTSTGSANVRKRKLLASQANLDTLQDHHDSAVSLPAKRSISPKNGTDLASNLLAQFANEASKAQHLSVSVVGNLAGNGHLNINGKSLSELSTSLSNGSGSPLQHQAYPCTSCHKTFATEVDLKAHTLRHLTQHPFVCYSCGKGFKYNHSLHFHIKQYHNGGADPSEQNSTTGSLTVTPSVPKDKPLSLRSRSQKKPEIDEDSNDVPLNLHRSTPTSGLGGLNPATFQTSELYQRLTLMDENHNAAGSAEKTGSDFNVSVGLFGKPPTNLPADSSIQIRSEKVLATVLEAINVHTDQSVVLYKCCLCAVAFATLDQLSVHVSNVHHQEITPVDAFESLSAPEIVCEKCSAKFVQQNEYEIHMQLHRSLEASQNATAVAAANASTAGNEMIYPFSLLSHLTSGSNAGVTNGQSMSPGSTPANTIDFRHIMASASKDTDFGRKFAAQLLAGDSDSGRHSPASASSGNKNSKSQDSNNNSLMFLVPEPSKPPSSRSQYGQQFKDLSQTRLNSGQTNANSGKTNGKNTVSVTSVNTTNDNTPNTGLNLSHLSTSPTTKAALAVTAATIASESHQATTGNHKKSRNSTVPDVSKIPTRNLKEPVDIFEGAGQSLPIQKFSVGDIQETSPGVFKCRFCDKCFDRVFSVHRHERVHTGFKPCICKTCGRGFSEKRNLRHHIIRFHSDGSGRDLLKRKRNSGGKNSAGNNISNSEFLSHYDRFMAEATGNGSVSSSDPVLNMSNDGKNQQMSNQNALHMSLAMLDRIKQEMNANGSDSEENSRNSVGNQGRNTQNQNKRTVNRRKSATKPPQKLDLTVEKIGDKNGPVSNGDPDTDMSSDEEEYELSIDSSANECNIKLEQ